jgi:hypothetical protein
MKERPLPFMTDMIHALENVKPGVWPAEPIDPSKPYKCQTRRVITPSWMLCMSPEDEPEWFIENCRYGAVGDRLWIRETWATIKEYDHLRPTDIPLFDRPRMLYYAAWTGAAKYSDHRGKWRPGMFMPRWASRFDVEIKSIRVERVQDISLEDAIAEGIADQGLEDVYSIGGTFLRRSFTTARYNYRYKKWVTAGQHFSEVDSYRTLWDTVNAKRDFGWSVNPWVWVIEFMRLR